MTHTGNPFGQVLVALVTPMTADGEVDWPAVEKHIDGVIAAGADGIVVTGTTGETSTRSIPRAASWRAYSAPIPELAPVIRAVLAMVRGRRDRSR